MTCQVLKHHNLYPPSGKPSRGSSLIRNRAPPGPYSRNMARALWGSQGGWRFLMSEAPLYSCCETRSSTPLFRQVQALLRALLRRGSLSEVQCSQPAMAFTESGTRKVDKGYLKKGIQIPMAQGRSTKVISMIKRIRTSRLAIKNSLS